MTLGIVVQARMGSSRLPGKVLREIAGKPLLAHVLGRLDELRHAATVVVATTVEAQDDAIAVWCDEKGVACFRGDELDVLDRYYQCARSYAFDHVVRLTADNPFTDVVELGRLIDLHLASGNDYTHAFSRLPIGVGAEIFTFGALERSYREGLLANQREHVNEYFTDMPHLFIIGTLDVPDAKAAPGLRLTVDTEEDWARADRLARMARGLWLETAEAIALCSSSA